MERDEHWQAVYETKKPDEVSWYQPHLARSLEFIRSSRLSSSARIVDVGGGASTLVDDLITEGYTNVAVVDLAAAALDVAKARLGDRAVAADWIVGDVTTRLFPPASVDFWHDRAVFHFLTDGVSRSAYLARAEESVKPGGFVLVATFGHDGPDQCSGLPVARYDAEEIHSVFGETFAKIGQAAEQHETPWGTAQSFVYCFCRRAS